MIKLGPLKIAVIYVTIGLLWILLSDHIIFLLESKFSAGTFLFINSSKGVLFVIVSGLIIYLLSLYSVKQILRTEYDYHDLFKSNPNAMWIYDLHSLKILSVNEAAIDCYGYTRNEFLNMTIRDVRPAEDGDKLVAASANTCDTFRKSGPWRHLKKNGDLMFVMISSHKINYQGKDAAIVVPRDVTDSMHHEEQLHLINQNLINEKKRLSDVQELTKIAGWDYDIVNESLNISDELLKILKVERDQLKVDESFFFKIIYHDDADEIIIKKDITVNPDFDLDVVHRVYSGHNDVKFFRQLGKIEYFESKPYKIRGTLQDITELKVIELERNHFNEENKRLGAIITKINNMVIVLDAHSRITWVNTAFEDFTGYKASDVIGIKPSEFLLGPDTDMNDISYINKNEEAHLVFSVDMVNYTKAAKKYWVNIEFTPMFDGEGKFTGYITVHNNITSRKEREDEITKQNVVLRDIAWLSSHEIRRPVASILGLMQLNKNATNQTEKDEYMNLVDECTVQLDQIIRKINHTIYQEQEKRSDPD